MKKVVVISTSADALGDHPTGLWAEELVAPYYHFKQHGYEVIIASIKGGEIPFDDTSLNPPYLTKECEKFLLDDEVMPKVENSVVFTSVPVEDVDAVFLPGGHGTCVDFPNNQELADYCSKAWAAGKVLAAVCHGPEGLVNVKDESGEPVVKGKKVTGFSNKEEYAVALEKAVPFLLEDRLKELGGEYSSVDNWQPYAIKDGRLITGQNPGSSLKVAELIVEALSS